MHDEQRYLRAVLGAVKHLLDDETIRIETPGRFTERGQLFLSEIIMEGLAWIGIGCKQEEKLLVARLA